MLIKTRYWAGKGENPFSYNICIMFKPHQLHWHQTMVHDFYKTCIHLNIFTNSSIENNINNI
jgi:hypothetical protein